MLDSILDHAEGVRTYLKEFFGQRRRDLGSGAVPRAGGFDEDVLDRMEEYAIRGKLIRGALVFLGYDAASGTSADKTRRDVCLPAAAAMELTQSFLLIHDDIMDRDETRRGVTSLHRQYWEFAQSRGVSAPEHFGNSLGICVGDVALFWALELLARAGGGDQLLGRFARELNLVGLAQMDDVYLGQAAEEPTVDRVVQVYRFKTGRYTFSLPLMLGAQLAGAGDELLATLATFGEELGVVFQIRDDQLGIFGDASDIGKPPGSDISADKKTIFRQLLIEKGAEAEVMACFGRGELSATGLARVREAVVTGKVLDAAEKLVETHNRRALTALDHALPREGSVRREFEELLRFNAARSR